MHELRTGEVGRVRCAREHQERADDPHRMKHRIGKWIALRLERYRISDRINQQRHRQPEQRRLRKVYPQRERIFAHGALRPRAIRRLTIRNVATVTSKVTITEITSTAATAMPCAATRSSFCTTPTPAGTNSSDRVASSP